MKLNNSFAAAIIVALFGVATNNANATTTATNAFEGEPLIRIETTSGKFFYFQSFEMEEGLDSIKITQTDNENVIGLLLKDNASSAFVKVNNEEPIVQQIRSVRFHYETEGRTHSIEITELSILLDILLYAVEIEGFSVIKKANGTYKLIFKLPVLSTDLVRN